VTFNLSGGATAPALSPIADQTVNQNTATLAIPFTVGDPNTPPDSLTVTTSSSNLTLVPSANIILGGSGANRTVTVTPAAGQIGMAQITLTVANGSSQTTTDTFVLT